MDIKQARGGYCYQKGGLPDQNCRILRAPYGEELGVTGGDSPAHHCNVHHWPEYCNELLSLLTTKVDYEGFCKTGSKPISTEYRNLVRGKDKAQIKSNESYKLPENDSTYIKMSTEVSYLNDSTLITLNVDYSGDVTSNYVLSFLDKEYALYAANQDKYEFVLPCNHYGPTTFYIIGRTTNNELVANTVVIDIPQIGFIESIAFEKDRDFCEVGQNASFTVMANWSNGGISVIEPSFTSTSPDILEVTDEGIFPVKAGKCSLIASYQGHSATLNVDVYGVDEGNGIKVIAQKKNDYHVYYSDGLLYIETSNPQNRSVNLMTYDLKGVVRESRTVRLNGSLTTVPLSLANSVIEIIVSL